MAVPSLNQSILLGFVGKDPEMRQLPDGRQMATFQMATQKSYRAPEIDEPVIITDWHTVKIFGNLSKVAEDFIRKGSRIQVIGELKNNNYTDKQGVKHYGYYIQAYNVLLLDYKDKLNEEGNDKEEAENDNVDRYPLRTTGIDFTQDIPF